MGNAQATRVEDESKEAVVEESPDFFKTCPDVNSATIFLQLYTMAGIGLQIHAFGDEKKEEPNVNMMTITLSSTNGPASLCEEFGRVMAELTSGDESAAKDWARQMQVKLTQPRSDQKLDWSEAQSESGIPFAVPSESSLTKADSQRREEILTSLGSYVRIASIVTTPHVVPPKSLTGLSKDGVPETPPQTPPVASGNEVIEGHVALQVGVMCASDQIASAFIDETFRKSLTSGHGDSAQGVNVDFPWSASGNVDRPMSASVRPIPVSTVLTSQASVWSDFKVAMALTRISVRTALDDEVHADNDATLAVQNGLDSVSAARLLRKDAGLSDRSALQTRYWTTRMFPQTRAGGLKAAGVALVTAATLATAAVGGPKVAKEKVMRMISAEVVDAENKRKKLAVESAAIDSMLEKGKNVANFPDEKSRADYLYSALFGFQENIEILYDIEERQGVSTPAMLSANQIGLEATSGEKESVPESPAALSKPDGKDKVDMARVPETPESLR